MWPYFLKGQFPTPLFFLFAEFLRAIVAGYLFINFGSVLISGCWTFVTSFFSFSLLSPSDSGLVTFYYLVTSNHIYSLSVIFLLILGGASLAAYSLRRNAA